MFNSTIIGRIGGDAEVKQSNGKEFTTFRVADTDRWTDDTGQVHETTTWIDCIMNGKPAVLEYLKRGTQVFVSGTTTLRIYSSPKDKCMKAGCQINVRQIELLGGRADEVPSRLYDANTGSEIAITKHFFAAQLMRTKKDPEWMPLVSKNGARFVADRLGWVVPFVESEQPENHGES